MSFRWAGACWTLLVKIIKDLDFRHLLMWLDDFWPLFWRLATVIIIVKRGGIDTVVSVWLLLEHERLFDLISVTAGQSSLPLFGNDICVGSRRRLHRIISSLEAQWIIAVVFLGRTLLIPDLLLLLWCQDLLRLWLHWYVISLFLYVWGDRRRRWVV